MDMKERHWFLNKVNEQIKEENKAKEKSMAKPSKKMSMPKTRRRR